MISRQPRVDAGIGVSFIVSTVIHLAVFLLLLWWGRLFPVVAPVQQTYYVDVVNLPVADPRSGSPVQKGNDAERAPVSPPLPASEMRLPEKSRPASKTPQKMLPAAPKSSVESHEAALAERLAKLEKAVESRQEDAVMERLRNKVRSAGNGRSGMPSAVGSEQGSDYPAYIQSRLKDAFRDTISYSSKNPEIIVRLFIDPAGRVARSLTERSSGDRAFELSVMRAIDLAGEKFPPPPGKKAFEGVFVFKPQGITHGRSK